MMSRHKTTKKRKLSMNKKIRDDELLEIENDFYVFSELENDIDDREAWKEESQYNSNEHNAINNLLDWYENDNA